MVTTVNAFRRQNTTKLPLIPSARLERKPPAIAGRQLVALRRGCVVHPKVCSRREDARLALALLLDAHLALGRVLLPRRLLRDLHAAAVCARGPRGTEPTHKQSLHSNYNLWARILALK